jgi:hypothetical protein
MHQDHSFGHNAAQPWQISYQARKLETRMQIERSGSAEAQAALSRQDRYQDVAANLVV